MSDPISNETVEIDHSRNFELMLKAFGSYLAVMSDLELEKELCLSDRSVLLTNLAMLSADGIRAHKPLSIYHIKEVLTQRLSEYFKRRPISSITEIRISARKQSIIVRFSRGANSHHEIIVTPRLGKPTAYEWNDTACSTVVGSLAYHIMQYASSSEDPKRELEVKNELRKSATSHGLTTTPYQQRIGRLEV